MIWMSLKGGWGMWMLSFFGERMWGFTFGLEFGRLPIMSLKADVNALPGAKAILDSQKRGMRGPEGVDMDAYGELFSVYSLIHCS